MQPLATFALLAVGVLAAWLLWPRAARLGARLKADFHRSVSAEPTVLVSNGRVIHRNLEKADMSVDELHTLLEESGAEGPHDTMAAMLHSDGVVGVVLHRRHRRRHRLLRPRRRDRR